MFQNNSIFYNNKKGLVKDEKKHVSKRKRRINKMNIPYFTTTTKNIFEIQIIDITSKLAFLDFCGLQNQVLVTFDWTAQ